MIQITPQMRVLVAVEPVDLRKGIDGLAAVCREKLQADPFSGWLFIFRSRRATARRPPGGSPLYSSAMEPRAPPTWRLYPAPLSTRTNPRASRVSTRTLAKIPGPACPAVNS